MIPHGIGISPFFNAEDLPLYCVSFHYLVVIPDLPSSSSPEHRPYSIRTPPPTPWKHCLDEIEDILYDVIVSTTDGGY